MCPWYEKYGNGRMDNSNGERMTKKKWDAIRSKRNFEQNANENQPPAEYEPPVKKAKTDLP